MKPTSKAECDLRAPAAAIEVKEGPLTKKLAAVAVVCVLAVFAGLLEQEARASIKPGLLLEEEVVAAPEEIVTATKVAEGEIPQPRGEVKASELVTHGSRQSAGVRFGGRGLVP